MGLKDASKVMMPLLFIIFAFIIGLSLSLLYAMAVVLFFLKPDFSKLTIAGFRYRSGAIFLCPFTRGYQSC